MPSNYATLGAIVFIIIGLIMLIYGVMLYEQNKNASSSASNTTWLLIGFGIFFLLIGIALAFYSYRGGGIKKEIVQTSMHHHHPDPYGVRPAPPVQQMYPGYGYPGYDTSPYAQQPFPMATRAGPAPPGYAYPQ